MEVEGSSLPTNYVTILHLKERWLQHHHHQNSQLSDHNQTDSQFTPKPHHAAALKPPPRRTRNRRRLINQLKPHLNNHPKGDEEEHNTHQSNSKQSKKKKGSRAPKSSSLTHPNPNELLEPEPVEEKRESRHIRGRQSRNEKVVWEPKHKTTPLAQNVEELSHNHAGVVEAVAVEESNVKEGTNRRGDFGRFQGTPKPKPWKPPFGVKKKGQTSLVWVKKGESASATN